MTTQTADATQDDAAQEDTATYVAKGKAFDRDMNYIPDRITAEPGRSRDPYAGSDLDVPTWPVEPGRYRLVAAKACPWANRAIIVRNLLGLQNVISIGMPGPPTTAAAGPSTSTPTVATRCWGSSDSSRP